MRNYYRDDPHWIRVKYQGSCKQCGERLARGDQAFYYPKGRSMYCETCGATYSREFEAAASDEYAYSSEY